MGGLGGSGVRVGSCPCPYGCLQMKVRVPARLVGHTRGWPCRRSKCPRGCLSGVGAGVGVHGGGESVCGEGAGVSGGVPGEGVWVLMGVSVGKDHRCLWGKIRVSRWVSVEVPAGKEGWLGGVVVEEGVSAGMSLWMEGCPWRGVGGDAAAGQWAGGSPPPPPRPALHRSAAHPSPPRPPYKPAGPAAAPPLRPQPRPRPCCAARRAPAPARRPPAPRPPFTSKRSWPGSRRAAAPPPPPPPPHRPRTGPRQDRGRGRGWGRCRAAGAGAGAGAAVQVSSGGLAVAGSGSGRRREGRRGVRGPWTVLGE